MGAPMMSWRKAALDAEGLLERARAIIATQLEGNILVGTILEDIDAWQDRFEDDDAWPG